MMTVGSKYNGVFRESAWRPQYKAVNQILGSLVTAREKPKEDNRELPTTEWLDWTATNEMV